MGVPAIPTLRHQLLSNLLLRAKNVGAQRPTKIPSLSEWPGSVEFPKNQTVILTAILTKPATKQI